MKGPKFTKKRLISVSPFTVVAAVAFVLLGYGFTLISYAVVLLIHEFAHAIAAERLGYELTSVRVMPYGVAIGGKFDCLRPGHEIIIAAAGPAANLLCWIVAAGVWWFVPETYGATQLIAEASFFTAALNLLPVYPLDGGRVLHGLLSLRLRPETADRIIFAVGVSVGSLLVAACIFLIVTGANFTYATLCVFIAASLPLSPGKGGYERIYSMAASAKRLLRGLRVREIMVEENATLLFLYKQLRADCYTRFVLADGAMNSVAVITETELDGMISRFPASEKAISVAKSLGI